MGVVRSRLRVKTFNLRTPIPTTPCEGEAAFPCVPRTDVLESSERNEYPS